MRLFIFILITLFIIGIGAFYYFIKDKNTIDTYKSTELTNNKTTDSLTVLPQTSKDKVLVARATLNKDGFLVVRQMDDGKLSQVIEMSKPLKKGTHNDITVSLGSVDVSNSELIVMIYEDAENDGIFNDLDMPAINEDGYMTAKYVKTGKTLPTSITEDTSSMPAHTMSGMKSMAKIRYTDKGFIPDKIEVEAGSMVEFINDSSTVMWVASMPHPAHSKLPTFDQFRSLKKGAIYRYIFEKKGTWGFHDHINPSSGGVVTVN